MSRIRSIHPGLFTDEAFMAASSHARLLIIGLWTEAWDDGVFEWKPLTLKARLFPVDPVDVPALLDEAQALGFIQRFTVAGKAYGAIRNFRKYQRPKKPNSSKVLTDEMAAYVGPSSVPVPNQYGTGTEKSPQMEDGGWRGEEEEDEKEQRSAKGDDRLFERLVEAVGANPDTAPDDVEPIRELMAAGYLLEDHILPTLRAKRGKPFKSWLYFRDPIQERAQTRVTTKAAPARETPAEGLWVDFDTPLWASVVKARGKPPLKTWHAGRSGAFVRLSEIPTEGQAS